MINEFNPVELAALHLYAGRKSDDLGDCYELAEKFVEYCEERRKCKAPEEKTDVDEWNEAAYMLDKANAEGLLVEVVLSAIQEAKDLPEITPIYALRLGFYEWVK